MGPVNMLNTIGCVLCSHQDRHLLPPFIAAWEALGTSIPLVLLKDQDSADFDTRGLTTYPLLWEKDKALPLASGVAASLLHAANSESAVSVIKMDVDCIHQHLDWLASNNEREVVGFAHLTDDKYFCGAAYYITVPALTKVSEFLADKSGWLRPEDKGMAKAAIELGLDVITLPMRGTICGASAGVEYIESIFSEYAVVHCGEFSKTTAGRARVAFKMKRLNLHNGATSHRRAVVYPIKDGNSVDSNIELTMSLRSIHENLEGDVPVVIMSEKIPPNISGDVTFIKVDSYQDAIEKACRIADEILWMNDDIFILRPHKWEDFYEWVTNDDTQWTAKDVDDNKAHSNNWRKRKGKVVGKLMDAGLTTFDYSSHTPYLYDTATLTRVVRDFSFGYKTSFETAYGNVAKVPHRKNFRKLQRYHDGALPIDMSVYDVMNYSDRGATPHIRGFLLGKFPSPCKYEYHGAVDLTKTLISNIK